MAETEQILRVVIQDGKGFGPNVQALVCQATFGDATLSSPYSVARDKHAFNATLQWSTTTQQLRRLSSAGQNLCKVSVIRKEGDVKLGWVVLDMRKAKLNSQYSKEEGEWLPLSGGKPGETPPQLRIFHCLSVNESEALLEQMSGQLKKGGDAKKMREASPASVQQVQGASSTAPGQEQSGSATVQGHGAASPAAGPQVAPGSASTQAAQGPNASGSTSVQGPQGQGTTVLASGQVPHTAHTAAAPTTHTAAVPSTQAAPTHTAAPPTQTAARASPPAREVSYTDDFHSGSARSSASGGEDQQKGRDIQAGGVEHSTSDQQGPGAVPPPSAAPEAQVATTLPAPHMPSAPTDSATTAPAPSQPHQSTAHTTHTARSAPNRSPAHTTHTSVLSAHTPSASRPAATPTHAPHDASRAGSAQNDSPTTYAAQAVPPAAHPPAAHPSSANQSTTNQPTTAQHTSPPPPKSTSAPAATSPKPSPRTTPQMTDGPLRAFSFSLEVRSFQVGRRLPFSTASTYIQATLPPGLLELVTGSGYKLPTKMTPLRSYPAVDVARGLEGTIPNGSGGVEFMSGVLHLAKILARDPRVYVEVWHKEKFRADTLLGVASVPLTPLLHDQWVDGFAPVHALLATLAPDGSTQHEEKIQVGMLRVVLSLQDQGPAIPPISTNTAASPSHSNSNVDHLPTSSTDMQPSAAYHTTHTISNPATAQPQSALSSLPGAALPELSPAVAAAVAAAAAAAAQAVRASPQQPPDSSPPPGRSLMSDLPSVRHPVQHQYQDYNANLQAGSVPAAHNGNEDHQQQPTSFQHPWPRSSSGQQQQYQQQQQQQYQQHGQEQQQQQPHQQVLPTPGPPESITDMPEYDVAYQLEVWKRREESKWRTEVQQRESARMTALEGEWRKRERLREAEVAAMRTEFGNLEERARQVLLVAEERERKLVSAEETMIRRRKDMEREHAARMAEAEAAVRRLQVECEHQLEMERDRNTELARQRSSLEERVAIAEARFAALDQAFMNYRDQVRNTNEVALQRELLGARDAARRAEDKANRALKAKASYKEQVAKLAEQLARLYKQQAWTWGWGGVDAAPLKMAAQEHTRFTQSQQAETAALRQQLHALKTAAFAGLSPTHTDKPTHPPTDITNKGQLGKQEGAAGARSGEGNETDGASQGGTDVLAHSDQSKPAHLTGPRVMGHHLPQQQQQGLKQQQPLHEQWVRDASTSTLYPPPTQQQQLHEQWTQPTAAASLESASIAVPSSNPTEQQAPPMTGLASHSAGHGPVEEKSSDGLATPTRSRPLLTAPKSAPRDPLPAWGAHLGPRQQGLEGQQDSPMQTGTARTAHMVQQGPEGQQGSQGMEAGTPWYVHTSVPAQGQAPENPTLPPSTAGRARQGTARPLYSPNTLPQGPQPHLNEIKRLLKRKSELIASGAYSRDDPLITRIEQRVMELAGAH